MRAKGCQGPFCFSDGTPRQEAAPGSSRLQSVPAGRTGRNLRQPVASLTSLKAIRTTDPLPTLNTQRPATSEPSSSTLSSSGPKMVAVQNYHGNPAPPGKPVLTFQTGDVIELLRGDPDSPWWEVSPGSWWEGVSPCSFSCPSPMAKAGRLGGDVTSVYM